MVYKYITKNIILFSIIILIFSLIFFGNQSFGFSYFLGNLLVVVVCMGLFLYAINSYIKLPMYVFIKKIFWFSFLFRLFSILIIYFILHYIIGGDLSIEEYDTVFYDYYGRLLADSYKSGIFNSELGTFLHEGEFDDQGYIIILSLVYSIFDNILFAKLIQGLVDSFSVVLICKIAARIYGEQVGKTAAILAAIFFPIIVMASLHTKEVFLILFLLLSIYYTLRIVDKQSLFRNIFLVTVSLIALFSMRTIFGFIVLVSVAFYIFINTKHSVLAKFVVPTLLLVTLFFSLQNIGSGQEIEEKLKGYFGMDTTDDTVISGRSTQEYTSKGQSYAKYATGLLMLPQVVVTPYPSMVRTNIKDYDTSMQWFFTGGLLLWSYFSFFSFIGIYQSIKYNFKKNSMLVFILFMYIIVLVASVYITSTRFNMPKLVLLLMFTAVGLNHEFPSRKRYFILYAVFMSFVILGWNFIKLAGRGML